MSVNSMDVKLVKAEKVIYCPCQVQVQVIYLTGLTGKSINEVFDQICFISILNYSKAKAAIKHEL